MVRRGLLQVQPRPPGFFEAELVRLAVIQQILAMPADSLGTAIAYARTVPLARSLSQGRRAGARYTGLA